MILGIGTDIIDIRRIEELLAGPNGARFIERTFTADEQALAQSRENGGLRGATYARRFAAKEACAKALGTGIGRDGILFTDIAVTRDHLGCPGLSVQGAALKRLWDITPDGKTARLHISLSDDFPYATAYVIIEAI